MLSIIAVILIHSSPFDEIAQGMSFPKESTDKKEKSFSLKGGKTIEVKKFEFSGNQAITTSQLEQLTAPYLNRALSGTTLSVIKQRIEFFYKDKGYSDVQVSIPPNQKKDSLVFVIKEGKKR